MSGVSKTWALLPAIAAVNTLMSLTLCPHSVMSFFLRKQLEDSNVFTKLTGNWRGKLVADLLKANINSLCEWERGGGEREAAVAALLIIMCL